MTTGSRTKQFPATVSTTTGTGGVGEYSTKTWSGGDKAIVRPPRQMVTRPVVYYDPKGHKRYRWGSYRPPNRLPKRAYDEVHPYHTDYIIKRDNLITWSADADNTPWLDNSGTGTTATIGAAVSTDNVSGGWTSNDDLALLGKLREKVAGSDFNAGVFLGEGREALKMIAQNATKIYKAYKAARKGNFASAAYHLTGDPKSLRKGVANNWLELQYGWLPLLKDVKGGAEFLSHHFTTPPVFRVAVTKKVESLSPCIPGNPTAYEYVLNKKVCRGRILAILKEKDVVALSGLQDPLSVAWELLPYSFVIDWFIPIGNYLQARGLAQALTGTFVTTRTNRVEAGVVRGKIWKDPNPPYATTTWKIVGSNYYFMRVIQDRTISTTLPVPLPSVKPLSKVASWQHAANAVALLSQLKR